MSILIILLILGATVCAQLPCFGRLPKGPRMDRVKQSPYYQNGKFQYLEPTATMMPKEKSDRSKRRKPTLGDIEVVNTDLKSLPTQDLYIWFGHSSFLLQIEGVTILADPVFVKGSPVSFINAMFPGTNPYRPEDMPEKIDYLLISHDHWDHLDYQTVKRIRSRVGHVICPIGCGSHFERWGYSDEQIIELDWGESYGWFHCQPTRHFSGRGLKSGQSQRASWIIQSPTRVIFFSGDGGYGPHFASIGENYPDIDLAIMENGQYDKRWNQIHTMPNQLGKEVSELSPRRFVTIHHSKFALANHAWDEPRANEQKAASESGVPLIVCKIGEIVEL